jgi:hypothetical protein
MGRKLQRGQSDDVLIRNGGNDEGALSIGTTTDAGVQIVTNGVARVSVSNTGATLFSGGIAHNGLAPTDGLGIDQTKTFAVNLTLQNDVWIDTGISGGMLATGVYIFKVYVNDWTEGGGHYQETYAGQLAWFGGATNSTAYDNILLHRSGHAPNLGLINLRTLRQPNPDVLKLQIAGNTNNTGPSTYTFTFRRML